MYLPNIPLFYSNGANNPYAGGERRQSKEEIANDIGASYLIEDNPNEFENWKSKNIEPICYAQPWNLGVTNYKRYNWDQILKYLL